MKQTSWIIFSGAPSSGKTTTAELLRDVHQFNVRDEIARREITKLKVRMNDEELIQTLCSVEFCESMIQKKLEEEPRDPDESLIIDSGLPEGYSYFQLLDPDMTKHRELDPALTQKVAEHLNHYRYKLIFSFDMLPLEKDGVRVEDEPHRQVLHEAFRNAYEQLGYKIIMVPAGSREVRLKFVLNHILNAHAIPMDEAGLKNGSGLHHFGLYASSQNTASVHSKHAYGLKNYSGGVRFWNELVGVSTMPDPSLTPKDVEKLARDAINASSSACDLAGEEGYRPK